MAGDGFTVNTSAVDEAAGKLRAAGDGIRGVAGGIQGLDGSGTALAGYPDAGAAFDGMISTWTRELEGLGGYVASVGDGAATASSNYTVTEYGVSEMFGETS